MSIIGRKIDTLNGGATCRQCRHFQENHERTDILFGKVSEKVWCGKFDKHIEDVNDGQSCLFFMKPLFSKNKEVCE